MTNNKQRLEVPVEELVDELQQDEDQEQLQPLQDRSNLVSPADWADQQRAVPLDDDQRDEE